MDSIIAIQQEKAQKLEAQVKAFTKEKESLNMFDKIHCNSTKSSLESSKPPMHKSAKPLLPELDLKIINSDSEND